MPISAKSRGKGAAPPLVKGPPSEGLSVNRVLHTTKPEGVTPTIGIVVVAVSQTDLIVTVIELSFARVFSDCLVT